MVSRVEISFLGLPVIPPTPSLSLQLVMGQKLESYSFISYMVPSSGEMRHVDSAPGCIGVG